MNSVRAQSRLLGSVLWWYLLPGLIGLLVMTWGHLPINDPVAGTHTWWVADVQAKALGLLTEGK